MAKQHSQNAVREAYEEARDNQLHPQAGDAELPAWDDLPLAMRLVIVDVYYSGKRAGAFDARHNGNP